jgi:hypothetical protein
MDKSVLARASIVKPPIVATETPPFLHGEGVTDDTAAVAWYIEHNLQLPAGGRYFVNGHELARLLPAGIGYGVTLAG